MTTRRQEKEENAAAANAAVANSAEATGRQMTTRSQGREENPARANAAEAAKKREEAAKVKKAKKDAMAKRLSTKGKVWK